MRTSNWPRRSQPPRSDMKVEGMMEKKMMEEEEGMEEMKRL